MNSILTRLLPLVCIATLLGILVSAEADAGLVQDIGRYAKSDQPLPAEAAFPISFVTGRDGKVRVRWDMPEGYYLYEDKLQFASRGGLLIRDIQSPASAVLDDPFQGTVRVYRNVLEVVVEPEPGHQHGELLVRYQGCAEAKVCYPPVTRVFRLPG